MNTNVVARIRRCAVLAGLLLPSAAAIAQTGKITGTVLDQQGAPIYGAQVTIGDLRLGAMSNPRGLFTVSAIPVGSHQIRIRSLGFKEALVGDVAVREGEATQVSVKLEGAPISLGGIVVSASRQAERITDAPATITRIDASAIDNTVGPSWAGALKQVKGLDFIQVGHTAVAVNARGFNSSFNNRMLMMEDGRIAVLPENGLPVGQFTAIPKVDLAGLEVLVGPGAALYGPDASGGVITLQSKDPRDFPGTTLELSGGNRGYTDVQGRHAGVNGKFGYKITGEFQQADDWENSLVYGATGTIPEVGVDGGVNWRSKVARGSGALVYYMDRSRLEVSAGASQTDGVGQTNVGRNQLDDWQYNFAQAKLSMPNWFFNAYRTQSKAGKSYAINRFSENKVAPANATKTAEQIRQLSDWPSDGQLYAAEAQNNFMLPALLNTSIVWGGQYRHDVVSSDRQWLTDRLTGSDLEIDQAGLYAQTQTPLIPELELVLAARYDNHENYDPQFSPKAGLIFKPRPEQAFRLTYNRAFKSPSTLQTNFYIPDWTAVVAIYGNTGGFSVRNAAGATVATYKPLEPEENQTWELGYKGVLANRVFLDVAGFRSEYENFLSPLAIIANPFAAAPTFAFDAQGQRIVNLSNVAPVFLTYYNLGKATLQGVDAGLDVVLSSRATLATTMSWLDLKDVEVPAGREEAAALNSPNTKWSLGVNAVNLGNFQGSSVVRHVNSYYFRSGINMGVIPTFTTLDLNLGYRLPRLNALLNVGVSNLFSCTGTHEYAAADRLRTAPINKQRECGAGKKHQEMINMPAIGTMAFVGVRFHR